MYSPPPGKIPFPTDGVSRRHPTYGHIDSVNGVEPQPVGAAPQAQAQQSQQQSAGFAGAIICPPVTSSNMGGPGCVASGSSGSSGSSDDGDINWEKAAKGDKVEIQKIKQLEPVDAKGRKIPRSELELDYKGVIDSESVM